MGCYGGRCGGKAELLIESRNIDAGFLAQQVLEVLGVQIAERSARKQWKAVGIYIKVRDHREAFTDPDMSIETHDFAGVAQHRRPRPLFLHWFTVEQTRVHGQENAVRP